MLLKEWNELPESMKKSEVKVYYDILQKKKVSLGLKRLFDIVMSSVLIVLASPVLFFVAVWIKLDSQGPVFYRQERVTQYGRTFRIFKFRTMITNADKVGTLVTTKNDSRITRVGEKIRKCRLDELPQLFNILTGEMSFVGTRPEVQKYVDHYTDEMKATLLLPAGVTSLASINYRDEDEILEKYVDEQHSVDEVYVERILPDKMKYNLEYLKTFNIVGDIVLCVKTVI